MHSSVPIGLHGSDKHSSISASYSKKTQKQISMIKNCYLFNKNRKGMFAYLHIVGQQNLGGICKGTHLFHRHMWHHFDMVHSCNHQTCVDSFYPRNPLDNYICSHPLSRRMCHRLRTVTLRNRLCRCHNFYLPILDGTHIRSRIDDQHKHREHMVRTSINRFFHGISFR